MCVFDGSSEEVIRELFMDRDSEEESDESDGHSDSSFMPETARRRK